MAATPLKKHLVVVFLVLSLASVAQALPFFRWHIHIVNGMSGGQSLFAHCKSKDDDLGLHNLAVGTEFTWSFRVNLWDTTLFWCYLRKPNGQQVAFEAFWVERKTIYLVDKCYVRNCIWIAKDEAIFLKNNNTQEDLWIHDWQPAGKPEE